MERTSTSRKWKSGRRGTPSHPTTSTRGVHPAQQAGGCGHPRVEPGYPASKYTDIKILNKVFHHLLEPGKRVEADEGYRGHPDKIKCPGNGSNLAMQGRVRAHHETINGFGYQKLVKLTLVARGGIFWRYRLPKRCPSFCTAGWPRD